MVCEAAVAVVVLVIYGAFSSLFIGMVCEADKPSAKHVKLCAFSSLFIGMVCEAKLRDGGFLDFNLSVPSSSGWCVKPCLVSVH